MRSEKRAKKKNRRTTIILLILLIAALTVTGVFGYKTWTLLNSESNRAVYNFPEGQLTVTYEGLEAVPSGLYIGDIVGTFLTKENVDAEIERVALNDEVIEIEEGYVEYIDEGICHYVTMICPYYGIDIEGDRYQVEDIANKIKFNFEETS